MDNNTIDECLKALITSNKVRTELDELGGEEYLTVQDITTILFNLKTTNNKTDE